MNEIMRLLLEGSDSNTEIETNEEISKEIEESFTPYTAMFETVFSELDQNTVLALEAYEMACIIGGTKVVTESLGQGEASVILTEASNGFFKKIKDLIIKAKDWFVGLVTKIIEKFKMIGSDCTKKFSKIEADFDKNFKDGEFTYKGSIIDLKPWEDAVAAAQKVSGQFTKRVSKTKNYVGLDDYDDEKTTKAKTYDKTVNNPTEYVVKRISKEAGVGEITTVSDFINKLKEESGYKDNPGEIKVKTADVKIMKDLIDKTAKTQIAVEKAALKQITATCNELVREISNIETEGKPNAEKYCTGLSQCFNAISQCCGNIINGKIQLTVAAAKSYLGWMTDIAKGKKAVSDGLDYLEEGFDMMNVLEGADCDDDGDDDSSNIDDNDGSVSESTNIFDMAMSMLM